MGLNNVKKVPWITKWNDRDRVGILLDLKNNTLTFYVNDKPVLEPLNVKRDCGYVPIFGIGGLKDGTTQCNIVVPPRLRYLPPLDNGILDTEKLEKVQSKQK